MNQENKICQNCKQDFIIELEDFDFYKKMEVPPPTWCPECRLIRRLMWRNERMLKKATCGLCEKPMLSMYSKESGMNGFCQDCWWSDKWDPIEYGREYDFSKPLFQQFKELSHEVPYMALQIRNSVDVPYANFVADGKNVYMSFSTVEGSEDVFYSKNIDSSRKIVDSFEFSNCENCYWGIKGDKNYNTKFLFDCRGCIDSSFLFDCANCQNCFMSSGLRNKSYYFRNQQYTKEEYQKLLDNISFGSNKVLSGLKEEFEKLKESTMRKFAAVTNCVNFSGDDLRDSKNAFVSFSGYGYENVKYIFRSLDIKDSMDAVNAAHVELFYEFMAGGGNGGQNVKFSFAALPALVGVEYMHYSGSSSHCFACIGLRNKQYCILNKQYTKEEYELLIPKIKQHMFDMPYIDQKGRVYTYGEFFPSELSPFGYNETIAQEYFPLTKAQALAQGFSWKDPEEKNYTVSKKPDDLSDSITQVPDSIVNEVIGCMHEGTCTHQCTTAFKIIPQELEFYRRMHLPLPRLCPNCRHYERLAQRNPLRLWKRQCMCDKSTHRHEGVCSNEFETSYAPERKEIVYCESCYQAEVV